MTTNFCKLMVLSNYINVLCCFGFANILIFIIHYTQIQKKYTATRCGIFTIFCVKLAYLQAHHREVIIRISTCTVLLNLTLKFLNDLH